MRIVVPFAAERPKTRLEGVLEPAERVAFSRAMLADVLDALDRAGHEPEVLATAPITSDEKVSPTASAGRVPDRTRPDRRLESVPVRVDDRALTPAINAVFETASRPVAVVMADLALATPAALDSLFDAAGIDADGPEGSANAREETGLVALAPGRGGGTNAVVSTHPEFRVDYHGTSFLDHGRRARAVGATVRTVDSFRLATDIDEPADLAEVLIHASDRSRAAGWLRDAGFSLAITDGRVGVQRSVENGS